MVPLIFALQNLQTQFVSVAQKFQQATTNNDQQNVLNLLEILNEPQEGPLEMDSK